LPLKKAFVLQLIDESYKAARMHSKPIRKLLLAEAGGLGD
jgi:hypothetical protein